MNIVFGSLITDLHLFEMNFLSNFELLTNLQVLQIDFSTQNCLSNCFVKVSHLDEFFQGSTLPFKRNRIIEDLKSKYLNDS